ncbi:DUF6503 family protein [Psychroserpens sp. BH13MA-6]
MKFYNLVLIVLLLLTTACKNEKTSTHVESINYAEEELDVTTTIYPEAVTRVFDAHGGLDTWQQMKTLKFTMPKPSGDEVTTTDLQHRYSLIQMPNHDIGFDGSDVWLHKKDTATYQGKPKFYYNLMFYFYAMPFVLADDGIIYEETDPLVFEGQSYPGIKVSYESGIGESPDDEYILYYDSKTHKMAWLGYTVTYFSKEKEKEFQFIKYSSWQKVNGLLLPETLTWFNYKNNLPTSKRNDVQFVNVTIDANMLEPSLFKKPENARIVE